jgi:hypothetical protein
LDAVQLICGFEPGEVRVIVLESEPAARGRGYQRYEIFDAATGLVGRGRVPVADMVTASPWLDESFDFPVEVERARAGASEEPAPVA